MKKLTQKCKPRDGYLCLVRIYPKYKCSDRFKDSDGLMKAIHTDGAWYIWDLSYGSTTEQAAILNETLYTVTDWTYFNLKDPSDKEIEEARKAYYD